MAARTQWYAANWTNKVLPAQVGVTGTESGFIAEHCQVSISGAYSREIHDPGWQTRHPRAFNEM